MEQGDQAAAVEQQPQLALASSLSRSLRLHPEGWLRWTYDMGAAISAFPLYAKIGSEMEANVATNLIQENSSPAMALCVCKERLDMVLE